MRSTSSSKPASTKPACLRHCSTNEIARRTITAHQNIALGVTGKTAPDFGRFAPDDLRIVAYILPSTGSANIGKSASHEKLFFVDPTINHVLKRKGTGCTCPKIFALIWPRRSWAVFEPAVSDKCFGIILRCCTERGIQFNRWNTNFSARGIVRGQHDLQHRTTRRCGSGCGCRRRCRCRSRGRRWCRSGSRGRCRCRARRRCTRKCHRWRISAFAATANQ